MSDITCECGRDHKEIVEHSDDTGVTGWSVADRCSYCLAENEGAETSARIGQHWLEVALERINAGEPEQEIMLDYGYLRVSNGGNDSE